MNHTHYYEDIRSSSALFLLSFIASRLPWSVFMICFFIFLTRASSWVLLRRTRSPRRHKQLYYEHKRSFLYYFSDTPLSSPFSLLSSILSSILSYTLNATWSPRRHVFLKHKKYKNIILGAGQYSTREVKDKTCKESKESSVNWRVGPRGGRGGTRIKGSLYAR